MATIQGSSQQARFQKLLQEAGDLQLTDLEQFIKQLQELVKRKKSPKFSKREALLIRKINEGGPSQEFWKKYDVLAAKLEEKTMTEKENIEFLKLVDTSMKWSVDRMKLVSELAEMWEISVEEVFIKLNIQPRERIYA